MKVKDLLKLCNEMSDLNLPVRYSYDDGRDALQDNTVQKLITCVNSVLEELFCNYGGEAVRCQVTAKGGFIDTAGLYLNRVLQLTDIAGQNVKYRYAAGGLNAADGDYTLVYAKLPPKVYWEEEIPLPGPQITERILAYGVLAEYFLSVGDLDVAQAWYVRYQNALHAACAKKTSMNMPAAGRWA